MERIAEKLSEIEKTARAIVDNAQEQKHQMEMQMQKKRDAFDADMEKETNEKILKIVIDILILTLSVSVMIVPNSYEIYNEDLPRGLYQIEQEKIIKDLYSNLIYSNNINLL